MPDSDEPGSADVQNNPGVVAAMVVAIAGLVLIIGCIAAYSFAQRGSATGQGTAVIDVTGRPTAATLFTLTPSLTPIRSASPLPSSTPQPTDTPNLTATITNIPALRYATLSEIKGTVQIRSAALDGWTTIDKDITVIPGTAVLTSEKSSVKITLSEGTVVRLGSQTQFTLTEIGGTTNNPAAKMKLDFGKVWAIVASALGRGSFEVQMPVGVASVRGSFMSAEHNTTDQVEIVTCLEGLCHYENPAGGYDLTDNQQTESINGGPPSTPHPMDRKQLADWAKQNIPEVATLTPTATPTKTRTATRTPTNTLTPSLTFTPSPTFTPTPTNLLQNGSFEGGFTNGVANGWASWTISDPNATSQNNCGRREPTFQQISSSLDARRVNDGSSAQQILTPVTDPGFGFYGGLQQTVSGLIPGKTYRFTIWASSWSSTGDNPAVSEGTGPVWFQIGIGQGATYAADPNIKRSDLLNIKDSYAQLSVESAAIGNTLTVFTYANPSACSKHNEAFFDAALLTELGPPVSAPTHTPLPPTSAATATPGPAVKLAFIVQPSNAATGAAITPAIQVAIRDATGRTVTDATNTITLVFGTNAGGGTLAGTLSVGPVNGVATFSNISIDKAATGYTLKATASGLMEVTSAAFNITPTSGASFSETLDIWEWAN